MRHGEIAYFPDPALRLGPQDALLTAAGAEQASATGRAFADVRFDRVITSGLPRTEQTAELFVAELAEPPRDRAFDRWPEFHEIRPGPVEAIPDEELEAAYLAAFRASVPPETAYVQGETVGSMVERVGAAMARLYADPSWNTALIVAHGAVNRAILSWLLAGPGAYFGLFEQSFGCVNIIDGEPPDAVIRVTNLTVTDVTHSGSRLSTIELLLAEARSVRHARSTTATSEPG